MSGSLKSPAQVQEEEGSFVCLSVSPYKRIGFMGPSRTSNSVGSRERHIFHDRETTEKVSVLIPIFIFFFSFSFAVPGMEL